jgi:hypothetical protein
MELADYVIIVVMLVGGSILLFLRPRRMRTVAVSHAGIRRSLEDWMQNRKLALLKGATVEFHGGGVIAR